ncbi:twin-arginine translocase TatA/TatE family subunit [Paenibacillus sp. CC-CFT747]|nr:twin-arginine translocase TatA/TatE family subunit [Paenibacillus sp. CC-CFT747]
MHTPSAIGILLIVLVALLLFGPNKLPELGRAFGKTLKEFKNGAKDIMNDDDDQKPVRKEIPAEEVRVHETRSEAKPEAKKPDNRRLPD